MEAGSQTEPVDPQDILNLLRQKSLEMERGAKDQDEIHSAELLDGEVYFNSHNESELRKNIHSPGKSSSTKSKSNPSGQPSLADKICDAVWSRKGSIHGSVGPSRTSSSKSSKTRGLVRSQSFKGSSSHSPSSLPKKTHCAATAAGICDARRPSGCASYIIRSYGSRELHSPSSPKFDSARIRRSHGDIDIRGQISSSTTLGLPSREDSVKSTSSWKSMSPGPGTPAIVAAGQLIPGSTLICPNIPISGLSTSSNNTTGNPLHLSPQNNLSRQMYRLSVAQASNSSRSMGLVATTPRSSRNNSLSLQGMDPLEHHHLNQESFISKERQRRKYVILGFFFLLFVSVACVVISLSISPDIDAQVRKENENMMRVIQTTSFTNQTNKTEPPHTSTEVSSLSMLIEDQDESATNLNYNGNVVAPGLSVSKNIVTLNPDPGETNSEKVVPATGDNGKVDSNRSTTIAAAPMHEHSEKPLALSVIGEILLNSSNQLEKRSNERRSAVENSSKISIESFASDSFVERFSDIDIDENDGVKTSIRVR